MGRGKGRLEVGESAEELLCDAGGLGVGGPPALLGKTGDGVDGAVRRGGDAQNYVARDASRCLALGAGDELGDVGAAEPSQELYFLVPLIHAIPVCRLSHVKVGVLHDVSSWFFVSIEPSSFFNLKKRGSFV